jgi:N-acetylglucosamine kinase-like BadF-type ATPase
VNSVIAIDAGRTDVRAVPFRDGERGPALTLRARGTMIDPAGVELVASTVIKAVGELEVGLPAIDAICIGCAGVAQAPARAEDLALSVTDALGAPRILVVSDMVTSHAGTLGRSVGVVVAAGTGAVAFGADPSGRYTQSDGWGYLVGDEGGGYAIGRAGLGSALREHDGRGGSKALLDLVEARFGSAAAIPALVHSSPDPARVVASFAVDVAGAARAGDPEAREIWELAGLALAEGAAACGRRLFGPGFPFVVSYTGGLFRTGDLLLPALGSALARIAPEARLQPPAGDALDGARLIAEQTLAGRPPYPGMVFDTAAYDDQAAGFG